MVHNLYGDGVHDDTAAIQEMIDGSAEVALPMPKVHYLISKPLELHSNCRLVLPRFAEIRLAKGSNCVMLKNKTVTDRKERKKTFYHVNEYSPNSPCQNIEVVGGIWNGNNAEQEESGIAGHWVYGFLFYNVRNLRISSLTLKNTCTFGATLDTVSYFTVDNIVFDHSKMHLNTDGIHCCGNCHFGQITNLKGACYDDLLAFNADEGSDGDITNIDVRGIYAEDCHSAVRLLNVKNHVENIHISEVHGTYYTYCIGITKYYPGEYTGYYDAITIDNVTASKAAMKDFFQYYAKEPYAVISIENVKAKNIRISDVYRKEYNRPFPSIQIREGAEIENLILDNITYENHSGQESMPMFLNQGIVKHLDLRNLREG